jgi:hypothetical protein
MVVQIPPVQPTKELWTSVLRHPTMAKAEGNRRRKALPIVTGFERGCERISNQPNLKRVGLVIFGF